MIEQRNRTRHGVEKPQDARRDRQKRQDETLRLFSHDVLDLARIVDCRADMRAKPCCHTRVTRPDKLRKGMRDLVMTMHIRSGRPGFVVDRHRDVHGAREG